MRRDMVALLARTPYLQNTLGTSLYRGIVGFDMCDGVCEFGCDHEPNR
jgi:hypothetical protein